MATIGVDDAPIDFADKLAIRTLDFITPHLGRRRIHRWEERDSCPQRWNEFLAVLRAPLHLGALFGADEEVPDITCGGDVYEWLGFSFRYGVFDDVVRRSEVER